MTNLFDDNNSSKLKELMDMIEEDQVKNYPNLMNPLEWHKL